VAQSNSDQNAADHQRVEDAISKLVDDADFEKIQRRHSRFNIFDAIGASRNELRHSNFLAWLFDPIANHGLGSRFLREFLRRVSEKSNGHRDVPRMLEFIVADLDDAVVSRELYSIDILIDLPSINTLVVIENKIGAKAGENQLSRYRNTAEQKFPNHRKIYVFLTPDEDAPDDDAYLSLGYSDILDLLEKLIGIHHQDFGTEIRTAIAHYVDMLRRFVVPDVELEKLALVLYRKYKTAFDFIWEVIPDQSALAAPIRSAIEDAPDVFGLDRCTKSYLRFFVREWQSKPQFNCCPEDNWTKTKRNLLFEVRTSSESDRVLLALVSGPAEETIRKVIFDFAITKGDVFKRASASMGRQWATIYSYELLSVRRGSGLDDAAKLEVISENWSKFCKDDLPKLSEALSKVPFNNSSVN
jgi:hypothetical protein